MGSSFRHPAIGTARLLPRLCKNSLRACEGLARAAARHSPPRFGFFFRSPETTSGNTPKSTLSHPLAIPLGPPASGRGGLPQRGQQWIEAPQVEHPAQVVGQRAEAEFRPHFFQAAHQETIVALH